MRMCGFRRLVILLLLLAFAVHGSAAMELYLREQVSAAAFGLSMADVVEHAGAGGGRDALRRTPLSGIGSRPALVSAAELREQMRPILGNSYVLVGSAVAVVPAAVEDAGRRAFLQAFLAEARTLMDSATRRLEFEVVDDDAARGIDPSVPLEIRILEAQRRHGFVHGTVRVAYRQQTNTGTARSGECLFEAHHAVAVPVASRPLSPGDLLRDGAVRSESKWISELQVEPYPEVERIEALTVSRHVREGTVLSARLLTQPVLVRAGSVVTAFFRRGAVAVRLPARAQESGAVDEIVRIRMPDTGRRFYAVVTGRSEVRVDDP